MNTVWPPARASTASGTKSPLAGAAPRHHRLDKRPAPEINDSTCRASSANQADATRERKCSVCITSALDAGSGLASCKGSARSTTPSSRCGRSVPLAQTLSQGLPNTSSWPHSASAWAELYERLPEVGDPDKPKIVFFFDEAHLLFSDAPKHMLERIELVVRLSRSKGVGVYFITQNPLDVPEIGRAHV